MNRFENLTAEEIVDILKNKTKITLVISQELAHTSGTKQNQPQALPLVYIPSDDFMVEIFSDSSMHRNDINTRWATFLIYVSYFKGVIYYINVNDNDSEITVKF